MITNLIIALLIGLVMAFIVDCVAYYYITRYCLKHNTTVDEVLDRVSKRLRK